MKGTIYGIFNDTKKLCYVGSTRQPYPKKRFYRHRQDGDLERYGELFCDECRFEELHNGEYEQTYQLRANENTFIQLWQGQQGWNCINKNLAYCPPELRQTCARNAQRKWNATDRGKDMRKWQNYRHNARIKINKEILKYNKNNNGTETKTETEK